MEFAEGGEARFFFGGFRCIDHVCFGRAIDDSGGGGWLVVGRVMNLQIVKVKQMGLDVVARLFLGPAEVVLVDR